MNGNPPLQHTSKSTSRVVNEPKGQMKRNTSNTRDRIPTRNSFSPLIDECFLPDYTSSGKAPNYDTSIQAQPPFSVKKKHPEFIRRKPNHPYVSKGMNNNNRKSQNSKFHSNERRQSAVNYNDQWPARTSYVTSKTERDTASEINDKQAQFVSYADKVNDGQEQSYFCHNTNDSDLPQRRRNSNSQYHTSRPLSSISHQECLEFQQPRKQQDNSTTKDRSSVPQVPNQEASKLTPSSKQQDFRQGRASTADHKTLMEDTYQAVMYTINLLALPLSTTDPVIRQVLRAQHHQILHLTSTSLHLLENNKENN
nr:putative uncharacterized protein DDB_G0285119 [Lytechinus pictus]